MGSVLAVTLAAAPTGGLARDLLVILATAGLVAIVLRRLNLATIPGYLVAGVAIGPGAFGLIRSADSTASISHLATVLLMFTIGLHLDLAQMRRGLAPTVAVGVVSTILVALAGWPIAMALGAPAPAALAVTMALAISSTAVALRIIQQRRELHRIDGRLAFGVLLVQDLVALVMLAMLPLLAAWSHGGDGAARDPADLLVKGSRAVGGIAALIIVGRLVLPRLLREAARSGSGEVLLVVSAAIALAAAVLSAWLGFSPELGAFLAGFLLASTPFRYQLSGQLAPMRDLFMAVFFVAVGLGVSPAAIAAGWPTIVIALVCLLVVKSFVIGLTSWAMGASVAVATYVGLALAQGGEFSLVILQEALGQGIITPERHARSVATVVLSLMLTPLLFQLVPLLAERARAIRSAPWIRASALRAERTGAEDSGEPAEAGPDVGGRAIVAGFGPVGRAVADQLERRGVVITIIELNPRTVRRQHDLGRSIVYGDAANPEVLESAGVEHAEAVILAMPDEEAVLRACRLVRSLRPDVFIAARANVLSKALQAMQLGADHVVVEEMAAAEAMAAQVIKILDRRAAGEDTGPKLYRVPGEAN